MFNESTCGTSFRHLRLTWSQRINNHRCSTHRLSSAANCRAGVRHTHTHTRLHSENPRSADRTADQSRGSAPTDSLLYRGRAAEGSRCQTPAEEVPLPESLLSFGSSPLFFPPLPPPVASSLLTHLSIFSSPLGMSPPSLLLPPPSPLFDSFVGG